MEEIFSKLSSFLPSYDAPCCLLFNNLLSLATDAELMVSYEIQVSSREPLSLNLAPITRVLESRSRYF